MKILKYPNRENNLSMLDFYLSYTNAQAIQKIDNHLKTIQRNLCATKWSMYALFRM